MGLLDDGAGSFGGCLGYGSLYTRKGRRGQVSGNHLEEKMSVRSGELHRMRLTHEEYVLTSFYGDTEKARLDTGKSGGNVFFWVYSDMVVALHEIEIVAVVDEHGREAAKEGWIESQLLQMGF